MELACFDGVGGVGSECVVSDGEVEKVGLILMMIGLWSG